ncbi:Putative motility protein [Clostridium cavendishii DSM 21758]|uniref:Putative motility protein n=1 Tax=Clostridium cavendishii DSM 21758 TaxID=1121302 RepID=A0A1M6CF26_9CLOT|nr:YjfB family protein [Clostridium cavendishii]SHI59635.1 Putative motility protein [Clostridium cavendishii DSM 21758]
MDIGALSVSMHQSALQDAVGISLLKMSMDTGKENANNMTKMIETCAIDPNRGQLLDVKV